MPDKMPDKITDQPLLIADIGGTNARFALVSRQVPWFRQAQTLQAVDFATIEQAIDAYLETQTSSALQGICFAVAGPIQDQSARFTNNHWFINRTDLRHRYGTDRVQLLNDFEAIAYSLAQLGAADLQVIGRPAQLNTSEDFTLAVLGPGSGLGVAGLCQRGNTGYPLATEAGHIGFSAKNSLQINMLQILHRKFGRVSNERLLSGPGLVNIHEALCELNNQQNPGLTATDIAIAGAGQSDPLCTQSLALFFELLGQVAGDIALALGAWQGIFIGGGIAQRYPEQLASSKFRQGFENKGRYRTLMESIPTWLITHKNPGLLGSSVYARCYL